MRRVHPDAAGRTPKASALEDAFVRRVSSLRGRLLVASLVALVALTSLALALAWRQYEAGKQEALREIRARAILAGAIFDTYFAGKLSTLEAMAASPAVVSGRAPTMSTYFRRLRRGEDATFTAGVGWIDRNGVQRATSTRGGPSRLDVSDRSYFRRVMATGEPFVSEAIVTRVTGRRVVVMAAPTHDANGRPSGVIAGGLVLTASGSDSRAVDLGYAGLQVIDRAGQQVTTPSLAAPRNAALVARLREQAEGVLSGVRGLDGAEDHVVAFATSRAPGWKTVIDQPSADVFAAARRALFLELALIAAAAGVVLGLIGWAVRRSRTELRAERAQIRRWTRLTAALNEAADVDTVCSVLAVSLASELPHALVAVELADEQPGAPAVGSIARGLRAPRAGRPDELSEAVVTANVPLEDERRRPMGSVTLSLPRERPLDEHDLALVRAHAGQAGQAVVRLRRHEQEHDTAILLQRSLLPDALPVSEGIELAAHYQAGGAHEELVGGDWYDVVRRPDGVVHLTVGDVAGRGIGSAVLMGQLRNAFRAYALDHVSPGAIVRRLARHVDQERMATMGCVTVDPLTREVVYASAGHLPALLVDCETGGVTRLDAAGSPPLGWASSTAAHDSHVDVHGPVLIALYTDGLVERRGASLDDGIDALGAVLTARIGDPVGVTADETVAALAHDGAARDDIALLLVRMADVPSRVALEIPAQPALLRELRRRVRAWLSLRGVDEQQREDAVLALSEACNNAIEHGYRDGQGVISIELEHEGGSLRIVVDDEGAWLRPGADPTRGRGLLIMSALMDDAEVVHKTRGTRVTLEQRLA